MIRNRLKKISNIVLPSHNIKIAITGLSRAGKTLFITSFIDQLLHQNRLNSVTASKSAFKVTIKPPMSNIKRFDYYTLIDILKNEHRWPDSTDEISHILLNFESKSRFSFLPNSNFTIELIDYPGEWLLDLSLLKLSYKEWSRKSIAWLNSIDDIKAKEYLKTIDSLKANTLGKEVQERLHTQYKELLIHLKKNHYSQLTPGRFVLPADLANDPLLHFAPIGKGLDSLENIFKTNYKKYVKEVVKEIHLEHFKGFERQVVLVDVIEALQNGYECYSDMKDGIKEMLQPYDHKNKNFFSQWLTPSIKNVLFVATKADHVAASQHTNFSKLLDNLVDKIRHDMDISHIKTDTQLVAALKSTTSIVKEHNGESLAFVRGILEKDAQVHDLYAGKMPHKFPNKKEWDRDLYGYENFLPPKKLYGDDEALEHINMDRVIEKLIGDLL